MRSVGTPVPAVTARPFTVPAAMLARPAFATVPQPMVEPLSRKTVLLPATNAMSAGAPTELAARPCTESAWRFVNFASVIEPSA